MLSYDELFRDATKVSATDAANKDENRDEFFKFVRETNIKRDEDWNFLATKIVGKEKY